MLHTTLLGTLLHRYIAEPGRRRLLLATVSFAATFALTRALTWAIDHHVGPFGNVYIGGRHIHHLVWGILGLLAIGLCWVLGVGEGGSERAVFASRFLSLLYHRPRREPERYGHRRYDPLAEHRREPRIPQRVAHDHRLAPAERRFEHRAREDHVRRGAAPRPAKAPHDAAGRVAEPHERAFAAEHVHDGFEHLAEHDLGVAHRPDRAAHIGVLARDLVIVEDELVLLVPADAQDVRERHGIGHLARLAHDEVGHDPRVYRRGSFSRLNEDLVCAATDVGRGEVPCDQAGGSGTGYGAGGSGTGYAAGGSGTGYGAGGSGVA